MAKAKLVTEDMLNEALQNFQGGSSNFKSYEKVFTESDWVETDGQYTITITNSDHELSNVNTVDLFKLIDDEYMISHGIFDSLDYTININNDNDVTITTTSSFSGKVILICIDNATSGGATSITSASTVILTTDNWVDNSQTVSVDSVTADNIVIVSPAPDSQDNYTQSKIRCVSQSDKELIFSCDTTPTSDINVNIVTL